MTKSYLSLGLMSGTSGDGVDASLIMSTGSLNENNSYEVIVDIYFAVSYPDLPLQTICSV